MRLEYQMRMHFGSVPTDPEEFVLASQITQAEACKYFMERIRVNRPRKTGILLWNLLDGWPQISDAVVNYDFTPKLAYFFIKRVQKPLHMAFADPADGEFTLMGINDTQKDEIFTYTVKDVTGLPVGSDLTAVPSLLSGEVTVPADSATPVAALPTSGMDDRFLLIEWRDSDGFHRSHFILEPKHLDYHTYTQALTLCEFDDWQGFDA